MKLSRLVGLILAGGCALLVLVALLLGAGVGTGIEADGDPSEFERPVADVDQSGGFRLEEFDERYAVIAEAPLFNEDRLPSRDEPVVEESEAPGFGEPEPVPLNVVVKGIIITPEVKLAIVTDERSKETQRLKEGMPLEGEMGGWTLAEIEPRKLIFDSASQGRAEVDLQVHTKALAGGAAPARTNARTANEDASQEPAAENQQGAQPMDAEARAEEIRRRVAERRAQLRAEAERRRQEQADEQ
ncbi:MAG: hypothetical protein R3200_00375 [Xanthomonadales bacterium]|nr:hypothetical protein [Xanthomonadales bacterium]